MQYETVRVTKKAMALDASRIYNGKKTHLISACCRKIVLENGCAQSLSWHHLKYMPQGQAAQRLRQTLQVTRLHHAGASGWTDAAVGHLIDLHDYQGIHPPKPNGTRASVLGEFGGLGLNIPAHTYMRGKDASSYMMFDDQAGLLVLLP